MKKKIIIIGAGIAGLSAGCYGQMNGYETEIYEMHTIPGGLCTSWDRKNYRIDGCIHWLMGTNTDSMFYEVWKDIGALEGKEFIHYDYIMQIQNIEGKKLIMYSDMDKLENHLIKLSPQDTEVIRELTTAVRKIKDIRTASSDESLKKYFTITVGEFVQRFNDPFLRESFIAFSSKENSVFSFLYQLSIYNNKDASWPIGGSLEFVRGIESKYLELGGKIHYNSEVEEILVADDRVTGIKLMNGAIHNADFVISAADGYSTIYQMLKENYLDNDIKTLYDSQRVSNTSIQISLGVDCDLSQYPYCMNLIFENPIEMGGSENTRLIIRHYSFDKTLCPLGKSVVTSLINTEYKYWEELYKNPQTYKAEKKRVVDWFIQFFEDKFPEAKGKIEIVDIATPMTYYRYTHVWQGAYCGWKSPKQKIPNVLPGLSGFYMAGQWTQTIGGLPSAVMTGKGSIIRVCKEDGQDFVSK